MNSGEINGVPYIAIGADEPEAKELIVHCACEVCGKQHYFNFWDMFRGEEIVCEHCGHVSRAEFHRLDEEEQ